VILLPARQPARKAIESQREISEPARDYVA